jgi:XPA protein C-terminus
MLTEEEKETIRKNRERALEIQRKRRDNRSIEVLKDDCATKKRRIEEKEEDEELEEFEVNASKFVSQKEAKEMYCLPDGTLAVCSFVEKDNPRGKGFKPMKLYNRVEMRRRARERYGGLEGLVKERERRVEKRFLNDLENTKNIFK